MFALLAAILFYGLAILFGLYSITMVYVLLRFGQSWATGVVLSVFYLIVVATLFAAAQANFAGIQFNFF